MDPDAKRMMQAASRYGYLGIFFGVAILLGFFAGRWLDIRLHTPPWFSLVGLFVGIAAGFTELYKLARRGLKDERDEGDDASGPQESHSQKTPRDTKTE